jgi:DNA-binding winged helix-turn-helix (wHTH) protein
MSLNLGLGFSEFNLRMYRSPREGIYEFDDFRFDVEHLMLYQRGEPIRLAPKAAETLLALIDHRGEIVSKDELIEQIWPDAFVEESNLFLYLSVLRKTLGTQTNGKPYLETLRRRGYRFNGEIRPVTREASKEGDMRIRNVGESSNPVKRPEGIHGVDDENGNGRVSVLKLISGGETDNESGPDETEPCIPAETFPRSIWRSFVSKPSLHRPDLVLLVLLVVFSTASLVVGYFYFKREPTGQSYNASLPSSQAFYWELTEHEKSIFIRHRLAHIQELIGDDFREINSRSIDGLRRELDWYARRRDSFSQEPFQEGLRFVYGRASQYVPLVAEEFEKERVPPAIGIYQAMVQSEYRDCPKSDGGPIGLFQLTRKTAGEYGLREDELCKMDRQSHAAARYMSDLLSDFGSEESSWTLSLLSFQQGGEVTREQLRELRKIGLTERNYWAIAENSNTLSPHLESSDNYMRRFFAAAIIGETPEMFELVTPPLSTIRTYSEIVHE